MSRSIALQTSLRPASIALTSAVAAAARHYDKNAGAPFRTALLHRTFAVHSRRRRGQGLSVAIVGSGPSGCYTAKYLQTGAEKKGLDVANMDVFDRLPTPYGTFHSCLTGIIKQTVFAMLAVEAAATSFAEDVR